MVPWVGLRCVIVVFSENAHLLFRTAKNSKDAALFGIVIFFHFKTIYRKTTFYMRSDKIIILVTLKVKKKIRKGFN